MSPLRVSICRRCSDGFIAACAPAASGRRIPWPAATPKASELEAFLRKLRLLISIAFLLLLAIRQCGVFLPPHLHESTIRRGQRQRGIFVAKVAFSIRGG